MKLYYYLIIMVMILNSCSETTKKGDDISDVLEYAGSNKSACGCDMVSENVTALLDQNCRVIAVADSLGRFPDSINVLNGYTLIKSYENGGCHTSKN